MLCKCRPKVFAVKIVLSSKTGEKKKDVETTRNR